MSPCLFNFYAEYIVRNAGLEEAQAEIKIAGRNINNLRYVPVPAGKVDQVPRMCTTQLRKNTTVKEYYNKDGVGRIRHVSTKGRSLTPTLFSILYLYRRA